MDTPLVMEELEKMIEEWENKNKELDKQISTKEEKYPPSNPQICHYNWFGEKPYFKS